MNEIVTWSSIFYWIGMLILLSITLYTLLMIYVIFHDIKRSYIEKRVKILNNGLEVFTKQKGKIAFYLYEEISHILVLDIHPVSYPKLVLKNQESIGIYASASRWILKQLYEKGIDISIEYEEGIEWIREEV